MLLGVSQGLTWSTTVIMKIDLAGPARRGFAMGLNEFAGYVAVAVSRARDRLRRGARTACGPSRSISASAFVADRPRALGLVVRETRASRARGKRVGTRRRPAGAPTQREVFWRTSFAIANLSSVSQAGLVNNLNDGMAWGLFPLFFARPA